MTFSRSYTLVPTYEVRTPKQRPLPAISSFVAWSLTWCHVLVLCVWRLQCFNVCSYCNFRRDVGQDPWMSLDEARTRLQRIKQHVTYVIWEST